MRLHDARLVLLGVIVALNAITAARADELRVFCPRGVATVLGEIGAQFEQKTGYRLVLTVEVASALGRRVDAGEPFDVFAGTPPQVAAFIKDGKLIADTRAGLPGRRWCSCGRW